MVRSINIAVALTFVCFFFFGARVQGQSILVPQPEYTSSRDFIVRAPQPAIELDLGLKGIKAFVFQRAIISQKLDIQKVRAELRAVLRPQSVLWSALGLLFPASRTTPETTSEFTILIDDFSQFTAARPQFASYFLREPTRAIGLDSSEIARAYWLPSLAHEITHLLLAETEVESWWEEGLAQLMEREAGGMQPELTLRTLSDSQLLPPLIDKRRPLASRQNYALGYLFARYLKYACGGWEALQVATGLHGKPTMAGHISPGHGDYLGAIAERLFSWRTDLEKKSEKPKEPVVLSSDKMTRSGLLRFFFVATAMNTSSFERYRIPGWKGSLKPLNELEVLDMVIEPSQMILTRLTSLPENLNEDVEVYRILTGPAGEFEILPRDKFMNASVGFRVSEDHTIVLNLQDQRVRLLKR